MATVGSVQRLVTVLVAASVWGCAATSAVRYPHVSYPPTNPRHVQVYHNFPPVKYEAIGEVHYEDPEGGDWDDARRQLQQEAASIGGDAVIVQADERAYMGRSVTHAEPSTIPVAGRAIRGVVIKFVGGTAYALPETHPEKFCPVGGERYPSSASFCPQHGVALKPLE